MTRLPALIQSLALTMSPSSQLAPEIQRSLLMRESWHLPIPHCEAAVYVHSVAVHHVRTDQSTIACKSEGAWSITRVSQDGPGGLLAIKKELTGRTEARANSIDAHKLDKLLAQPSVYTEVVHRTGKPEIGGQSHILQIVTPNGSRVARWNGRLRGKLGQIADIILGRASERN